jgi:hypothetical protein
MCRGIKSLVATGHQHICDLMSRARPVSQSRAAEKFGVVGVGKDDEDVLRGSPGVGHGELYETRNTKYFVLRVLCRCYLFCLGCFGLF